MDAPYTYPVIYTTPIKAEWLDYNNHMNVAYYVLIFDHAGVAMVGELGLNQNYTASEDISWMVLENHITYNNEVVLGQQVDITCRILDHDSKRLHLYFEMHAHNDDGTTYLASTLEQMAMCVDLNVRKACAFPPPIAEKISQLAEQHSQLPVPENTGRKIAIRRKPGTCLIRLNHQSESTMIDPEILHKAARKGLLKPEQVEPLSDFINQQGNDTTAKVHDEEQLKFVRNFGDIFITLGVAFIALSVASMDLQSWQWWLATGCFVALAEWLVKQRRLALPGIAILLSIIYYVAQAVNLPDMDLFADRYSAIPSLLLLSACSGAFYWRYAMPFSLFPLALSLVTVALISLGEQLLEHQLLFSLTGLAVFCCAMAFDSRDRQRQLRWSDCGFWLHLLASPLIVHGVMTSLIFSDNALLEGIGNEILLMLFFVIFMLVALFADRRAMLVSSSSYGIYAIFMLLENSPVNAENLPLVVFIGFGLFIIVFGTFWYKVRKLIFSPLQDTALARLVPEFK